MPLPARPRSPVSAGFLGPAAIKHAAVRGALRREGDFWTVAYADKVIRLKDSKGISYIAHLLRHPGQEFHALDLIAGISAGPDTETERDQTSAIDLRGEEMAHAGLRFGIPDDAGEMLDKQAVDAYRRRRDQLREELDDAKELGNVERAAALEDEIDALTKELARALAIGGQRRRSGSVSERARLNATRAIRSAIGRIADHYPALSEMLDHAIRTGTFCSYDAFAMPEVEWEVVTANAGAQPASLTLTDGVGAGYERTVTLSRPEDALSLGPMFDRTAFVGRESERSAITAAIDRTFRGKGSILLLGGEPGVGKTRLALECAREAAGRGALALAGRCYESNERHPYVPFVEMLEAALEQTQSRQAFREALGENAAELTQLMPRLRRLYTDIPPPIELPPQQARRYLFESWCDFLARSARVRPVFLLLDDLHWADESTLSLLIHLSNRIRDLPAMIAATYRDTDADPGNALSRTLEALMRAGFRPMVVKGLPPDAVARMLGSLCGHDPPPTLVRAIYSETEGNPFFVEELFKDLVEEGKILDASGQFLSDIKIDELDVPANVRLVIGRRLDRLPETTRPLLAAAAIIGRSFSFKLLKAVADADDEALLQAIDEAFRLGLIVSTSEGPDSPFNFVHELVRQTLISALSPPRRQRLHLQVAHAIEETYAGGLEEWAAEVAHHLIHAGADADRATLIHYLTMAGKRAMQAAAYEDALHHFEAALARCEAADSRGRAELLSELGMTKRSLDRWEEALTHWRDSLDAYTALGERGAAGRLSVAIVEALNWAGRYFDGAPIAYRALGQLEDSAKAERAWLLGVLSGIHVAAGDHQVARDAIVEAARLAEELGELKTLGEVISYRAFYYFAFARLDDAIADGLRAADLLRAGGVLWSLAQTLAWLQTATFEAGQLARVRAIGAELDPLAIKLGHSAARMLSVRIQTWCEFSTHHDLLRLEESFERDLEVTRAAKLPWVATCYARLSAVNFLRGKWDAALAYAEQACAAEFVSAFDGPGAGMLFRHRAYLGDRAGALELLEQKRSRLPRLDSSPNRHGAWALMLLAIEGLFVLGERAEAGGLYPLALLATQTGIQFVPEIARFPQTAAGISAAAACEWDRAEEHFQIARRQAQQFQHQLEQAEILRFHGQMLLERGRSADLERAHVLLTSATEHYEKFGMSRHAELTRSLLNNWTRSHAPPREPDTNA